MILILAMSIIIILTRTVQTVYLGSSYYDVNIVIIILPQNGSRCVWPVCYKAAAQRRYRSITTLKKDGPMLTLLDMYHCIFTKPMYTSAWVDIWSDIPIPSYGIVKWVHVPDGLESGHVPHWLSSNGVWGFCASSWRVRPHMNYV